MLAREAKKRKTLKKMASYMTLKFQKCVIKQHMTSKILKLQSQFFYLISFYYNEDLTFHSTLTFLLFQYASIFEILT